MIATTLNKIRAAGPCQPGWAKLLRHLGKTEADDYPVPFEIILDSNGLDDAIWCFRVAPEYSRDWRLFAVWCGRQVEHLMTDQRSRDALDVAERFANGEATEEELADAEVAAWSAACSASWYADRYAAWYAAETAAWSAAEAAAQAAAAARAAAWSAARSEQADMFRKMCRGTAPWQMAKYQAAK